MRVIRAAVVFTAALGAAAQTTRDPSEVLAVARDKLLDRNDRVPNYVCVETVNRSYFNHPTPNAEKLSCDQIMGGNRRGKRKLHLDETDRLRLDVKISEGKEIGAWAGARQFDSRSLVEFVGDGPFGTGPLGTLIGDIVGNTDARFAYEGEETLNGRTVFKYRYMVPVESSHYLIRAGTGWIASAFSGNLWIDPESLDLRRLTSASSELPRETTACVADSEVNYERVRIGERDFLLPSTSDLHFILRDGTETHNLTAYSNCHAYHAESTVRFDDATASEKNGEEPAPAPTGPLPAKLKLRLAFDTAIDTGAAAAGDRINLKVMDAVRPDHSRQTVIPAGAMVRGRIVGMRHFLGSSPHFEIAILPQSIEITGVESALRARLDTSEEAQKLAGWRGRELRVWLPPRNSNPNAGTFFFPSTKDRYVVPAGYQSKWITE